MNDTDITRPVAAIDPNRTVTIPAPPAMFTGIVDVFYGDADNVRRHGLTLTQALIQAKAAGLALCLIKVTEGGDGPESGTPYVDPECENWLNACEQSGVQPGFYHVGTDSQDGAGQAAFFARTLQRFGVLPSEALCALDRELGKPPMSPLHAEQFVCAWRAAQNRWPLYYRSLAAVHADYINIASPSLKHCPLWLAAYGEFGPNGPHQVPWFLWQDLGTGSGPGEWPKDATRFPRTFSGLGQMDHSVYPGTREELLAKLATVGS